MSATCSAQLLLTIVLSFILSFFLFSTNFGTLLLPQFFTLRLHSNLKMFRLYGIARFYSDFSNIFNFFKYPTFRISIEFNETIVIR